MKKEHDIYGMINEEETEIISYCHERHKIGECPWCDFIRVEHIVDEFMRRIDICEKRIKSLNMWSLGTSLTDTPSNHKILLEWWRIFHDRVKRVSEWTPVFRVVETGRRGFLHFHVICTEYMDHAKVLRIWRSITGQASNVHVSGSPPGRDPKPLIRYLVKYLTKKGSTYRWMGSLYGLGSRSRAVTTKPSISLIYGGVTCYKHVTEGYGERRISQRKI